MKKTTLKQRINNAANAFFENDQAKYEETSLILANDSGLLKPESTTGLNSKGDSVVKMLKRTFIFLPGAVYLFFAAMFGFSYQIFLEKPLTMLMVFLIGSFMTIFGIGDLKNPKHLAIPLSIVTVGITAFLLFSTFGQLRYIADYGIYFFPIALIAPFLAKDLVDKTDKSNN